MTTPHTDRAKLVRFNDCKCECHDPFKTDHIGSCLEKLRCCDKPGFVNDSADSVFAKRRDAANLIERHASDAGEAVAWADDERWEEFLNPPPGIEGMHVTVSNYRFDGAIPLYTHPAPTAPASDGHLTEFGKRIAEFERNPSFTLEPVASDGAALAIGRLAAQMLQSHPTMTPSEATFLGHKLLAAAALAERGTNAQRI